MVPGLAVRRRTRNRPVGRPRLLGVFYEADPDLDPLVIAAWANTAQRELDSSSPAEWIVRGGDEERVLSSARRATAGLHA